MLRGIQAWRIVAANALAVTLSSAVLLGIAELVSMPEAGAIVAVVAAAAISLMMLRVYAKSHEIGIRPGAAQQEHAA